MVGIKNFIIGCVKSLVKVCYVDDECAAAGGCAFVVYITNLHQGLDATDNKIFNANHMRVAFLGLGIMGRPMAANLVKAGHEVTVWNRTPGKEVPGAKAAATPAEAVKGKEAVWICVSDTMAVQQVLFGQHGASQSLESGTV